jgi:antitoxin YefM
MESRRKLDHPEIDVTHRIADATLTGNGRSKKMTCCSATEARANLYRLIDQAARSHEPVLIIGKRNNAILLSEEGWSAVHETLHLLSVPGMRESIREGMATPVDQCGKALGW